jgi:predicted metal-dependent hydrolase
MIEYQVQLNPRSRNLRLRITPKAEVVVSAPPRTPDRIIAQFVSDHTDWILKHQQQVQRQRKTQNTEMMVFGKMYKKVVRAADDCLKQPVVIIDDEMHISPVSQSKASVERALITFLKTTAQKYIIPRTKQFGEVMNISYASITLREQKTRWGSCSSTGALNFNWRLVQYPSAIIDYVIVHELAHRREMNHSHRFWAIVAKYDPDYQSHRQWLRKHGSTVD